MTTEEAVIVQPRQHDVARLDAPTPSGHTLEQLIASWLSGVTRSKATRVAYREDLRQYIEWCTQHGIDVLSARRPEADIYAGHLQQGPSPRTGRPYTLKAWARKLSAVASFYTYLNEVGAMEHHPFQGVKRPTSKDPAKPTQTITSERQAKALRQKQKNQQRCGRSDMWRLGESPQRYNEPPAFYRYAGGSCLGSWFRSASRRSV